MSPVIARKSYFSVACVLGIAVSVILFMQTPASAALFNGTRSLKVGALCDFVDDASGNAHYTDSHISGLMEQIKLSGVSQISWGYYADADGGFVRQPGNSKTVYDNLGNPFAKAVVAAHDQDLEVFGYFKPYEMGIDRVYPEGSPEAAAYGLYDRIGGKLGVADPYMANHPELNIQHRSQTLSYPVNTNPISTIKLYKSDNAATRIGASNIQIWTSSDNFQYQQQSLSFNFSQAIETAQEDVVDLSSNVITEQGDPIRVLTLSNLNITDPYVLVTTDFTTGTPDFDNTATHMMRTFDSTGTPIEGVFSNGSSIYNTAQADFRNWGLMYDHGYGIKTGPLDAPNTSGKAGLISFTRGKAPQLGAPCESEPLVQLHWLKQVKAILDSGADGVEFRIENHSTHTDYPEEYGYNQIILDQLPDPLNPTKAQIAEARGDAYTEFLIAAKKMISSRGKKMRLNFELDKLSGNMPKKRDLAYPGNMDLQWERWINLGLLDEAVFRSYGIPFSEILADPTTNAIANALEAKGIPLYYSRYIHLSSDIAADVETIRNDSRFDGFVFYETASYMQYNTDGTTEFRNAAIPPAMAAAAAPSAVAPSSLGTAPFKYESLPDNSSMDAPAGQGWWYIGDADTSVANESVYNSTCATDPGYTIHMDVQAGENGYYYQDLSVEQEANALANGWRMTVYARAWNMTTQTTVLDNSYVNPNFTDGVEKSIGFGVSTPAGDSCVGLETIKFQGTPVKAWTVAGLFGDQGVDQTPNDIENDDNTFPAKYCKYELSWNPHTKEQTLVVTFDPEAGDSVTYTLSNSPTASSGLSRIYFGMPGGDGYTSPRGMHFYVDSVEFTINPTIPGDANMDGCVDSLDAEILAANWQTSGAGWEQGDFNNDGLVDDDDATILAANWYPDFSTPNPEPSIAITLLGGWLMLLGMRRQNGVSGKGSSLLSSP